MPTQAATVRTLAAYARERAQAYPDRVMISGEGASLTYAGLLADAESLAAALQQIGLRRGDVVSFQLPNWNEAAVVNLAANLIGLLCNPIVPIYRRSELLRILADARTRCFFVPGVWNGFDYAGMASRLQDALPGLDHLVCVRGGETSPALDYDALLAAGRGMPLRCADLRPEDPKLLLFTSGTTGRAKAVMHSQESLVAPLARAAAAWNLGEGDCMLMPSPVTHVTGYCCGLEMPLFLGTRTVLMERWSAARAVELVEAEQVAATVGATPFLAELVDAAQAAGSRLPSLRIFACGGASVPPALIRRAHACLAGRTFRVYGLSEAPLVTLGVTASDALEIAAETDGRCNGYEVRIADPSGAAAPEGEILVRGAGMMLGYADPADNANSFTGDGFFRTGDLGRLVGDALVITGRSKDLIIRGGENISAKEIEDILVADARIVEAAAVSMPHPRLGETVCVFTVLAPASQLGLTDVSAILTSAGVARQKFPEALFIVAELPKTPSGKVRKDLLRERTWRLAAEARDQMT